MKRLPSRPLQVTAASVFGLAAAVLAVELLVPGALDRLLARSREFSVEHHRWEWGGETAIPRFERRVFVDITYPAKIRENETRPVVMTYRAERVLFGQLSDSIYRKVYRREPPRPQAADQLDRKLIVELSSSGFKIAPREREERLPGTKLPLGISWTLTPEGEGDPRYVLLAIAEEFRGKQHWTNTATVNGSPRTPNAAGAYELPVAVRHYSGLPRTVVTAIMVVAGIIWAMLRYPLVVAYFKKLMGLNSNTEG